MEINERKVENPYRHSIVKVSENGEQIIADIEKAEQGNVEKQGTLINAALLEKVNWRDDGTVAFRVLKESDPVPRSIDGITQIFTGKNGKTFLLPSGVDLEPVELGKVAGTTVVIGTDETSNEKDRLIFKSDPQAQMDKICADMIQSETDIKSSLQNPVVQSIKIGGWTVSVDGNGNLIFN